MNWSPYKPSESAPGTPRKIPVTSAIPTLHPNHVPYVQPPPHPSTFITPNSKLVTPQKRSFDQRHSSFTTPSTPTPRKSRDDEYKPGDSDDEGFSATAFPPSTQSRGGDRDERSKLLR